MNCGAGLKILFMYMIVYTCTCTVSVSSRSVRLAGKRAEYMDVHACRNMNNFRYNPLSASHCVMYIAEWAHFATRGIPRSVRLAGKRAEYMDVHVHACRNMNNFRHS